MAVNSIGDFIKSVFSPIVNKGGEIFRALLADDDETGTVEKMFKDFERTRKVWQADIYNQRGEQLEKSLSAISVLKRLNSDTDVSILARFALLFQRNGDTVWGDKWDTLKIFKTLFGTEQVWLVNNTEKFTDNLLKNGNFENESSWTMRGASYDREARFEGAKGIKLNSGYFFQSVNVKREKTYFLHFFVKGDVNVTVIANNGKYWNPNSGEFGGWSNAEIVMPFESEEWDSRSFFFITDSNVNSVKIQFSYEEGKLGYVDYVRLNEKTKSSTFSIISLFEGNATSETALYAPGTDDPIVKTDYDQHGHYARGESDTQRRNMEDSSFLDESAVDGNEHPLMDSAEDVDNPIDDYSGETFLDGVENPALLGKENKFTIDYNDMSYLDLSFIFGNSGDGNVKNILCDEIMEIVKPAGVTPMFELLTREGEGEE